MGAYPFQSLFIFNGLFVLGSTLVLAWLFRSQKDVSANFWMGAGFCSALATTLIAFKPDLPLVLGYVLPNTLQVMHQFFLGLSFLALCGVTVKRVWVLESLGLTLLLGAGLHWVSANAPSVLLVPYVSFVHGMLTLSIAAMIAWQKKRHPALQHLIFPQVVLLTLSILWLVRLPMSLAGFIDHALDPRLGNWLVFVCLLAMNIVLQFSYFGVRLADSVENRTQLVEINLRLNNLVREKNELIPNIDSGLLAFSNFAAEPLSAQLAHEVNQPLAALSLKVETLMAFPANRQDDGRIKSMTDDIERIATTVRGLQRLMQVQCLDFQPHDLNRLVDRTLAQMPRVEWVSPEDSLPVMVDAPHFAKTLRALVSWLQAYEWSSSHRPRLSAPVIVTCGATQDGGWGQIWLSAPDVHLNQNVITLLCSGKMLAPIGNAMPTHDVHPLIELLVVQHAMRAQRGRISVEQHQPNSGTLLMLRLPMAVLTMGILPVVA